MWCSHCNKEASAVPSKTVDGFCCAVCGQNLFSGKPSDQTIRQARDIVARWSSSDLLDQISTLPEIPSLPDPHFSSEKESQNASTASIVDGSARSSELDPQPQPQPQPRKTDAVPTAFKDKVTVESAVTPKQSSELETPQDEVKTQAVSPPKLSANSSDRQTLSSNATRTPSRRPAQSRNSQTRKQRERTPSSAAKNKGPNAVSRKLRVDNPGGDNNDAAQAQSSNDSETKIQSNSSSGRRHRIDQGQQVSETLSAGDSRSRTHGRARQRYIDDAHPSAARGPHFQVTPQRRSNLTSVTGQFLAYLGVLGLTIGTAMVIYGHFGGDSEYTPTGWLVTTVAQMMLFLGVINLVSGGIEQNNDDVSQRIDYLGEQLMRIEQVTEEALRGPKIPASRYANPDAPVERSTREHAHVVDND